MNPKKRFTVVTIALTVAAMLSLRTGFAAPPAPTNLPSLDSLPKPDLSKAPAGVQAGVALRESLSADQSAAINAILDKYQSDVKASSEAMLAEKQMQAGTTAAPNKAAFLRADRLVSQINAEINGVLNADQKANFAKATARQISAGEASATMQAAASQAESSGSKVAPMVGPDGAQLSAPEQQAGPAAAQGAPVSPDAAQAPAGPDGYTSNCFYSPYYGAYADYYCYYAWIYAYYDYVYNGGTDYAYYAYYYLYYAWYYKLIAMQYAAPLYFDWYYTGLYPGGYPYNAQYYAYYAYYYGYYGYLYAYYDYYYYGTTYGYYAYVYGYYCYYYAYLFYYYAYYCYYYV